MKTILHTILAAFLLYSCRTSDVNTSSCQHIPYTGKNTASLFDIIDSVKIIPLQHNDQIILGRQPEFWHRDTSFYLIDKHGSGIIYRFAENGRFLNTIGKIGRAPQEYIRLVDLFIEDQKNEITIISDPCMDMHKYSKQGTYIENKKYDIPITSFCKTENNYWLYLGYNNYHSHYRFLQADTNMQIIQKRLPLKTKIIPVKGYPAFSCHKEKIHAHEYFSGTIYEITNDSIKKTHEFDFGSYNVPATYFETQDPYKAFEEMNEKGFVNITAFYKTETQTVVEAILQKGSTVTLIYGLQLSPLGEWKWAEYTPDAPSIFMGNLKGFTKDNCLVCYITAQGLPSLSEQEKSKFTNPEILAGEKNELDMYLFLCHLKE